MAGVKNDLNKGLAGATPTLQQVSDEDNVVVYGSEETFVKYQTSTDTFAQVASDDDGFVNFEVQQSVSEKTIYGHYAITSETGGNVYTYNLPRNSGLLAMAVQSRDSSFTAVLDTSYTANGTLTVTDPTPITNKGYVVHVIGGTATIGGVDYTSGALVYRYYDGSVWASKNYGLSTSSDFVDDTAAASGGIPIGDLYHTSGTVKIRLT